MMSIWLLLVYLDIALELHMSQGVGLGSDFRLLRLGSFSSLTKYHIYYISLLLSPLNIRSNRWHLNRT